MVSVEKKLKVYLITGEPSGDLLGSRVMRALKKQTGGCIQFNGVGGETMIQEGLKSLFDISDLAVMGLVEVIPSLPKILKRFDDIITDIIKVQPDVIMTIDSFSFSVRVHKKLIKNGIQAPHVHYVAPQVWAWKKGRAKTLGRYVDRLFCLLPKEPSYFTPYGLKADFVGHPVIEGGADKGDAVSFRVKHKIPENAKVLCLLPGSRKNEVKYLLPIFKEAVEKIQKQVPDLFVVIPTVATVADKLKENFAGWMVPHIVVQGEKERYNAFAASQVSMAASGTVSLELAMAGVPHLIAYRVSPLTGFMARHLLKIKFVNLINLLVDKEIIPELLQENCTVDKLTETILNLLNNPKQETQESLKQLGLGEILSPSEKTASLIIEMVKQNGRA
ncbi:MAG: lipid-A-disaccharide synthase [Alphaproteobacteria bacterium]|nr:lipid-A-disaccharide synthase [Alphaproteobacteria bacterium]MBR3914032.1 lipid-A-disaccharide synthase [Alphaproteobacteria bacterium]